MTVIHNPTISLPETALPETIVYPESDGKPIAENTKQYDEISTTVGGLRATFAERPDVFVAGDLFWYPVKGNPSIVAAPDAMVVFGRPKGHRRSYKQWEEGNIPPQVVFEIMSPSNDAPEMLRKLAFYEKYGVLEYYVYDPDRLILTGWQRATPEEGGGLVPIKQMQGWVSPLLGVRFELDRQALDDQELKMYRPDGQYFFTYEKLSERADRERLRRQQAEQEIERVRQQTQQEIEQTRQQTQQEIEQTRQQADQQIERVRLQAERLKAQLRVAGLIPDEGS